MDINETTPAFLTVADFSRLTRTSRGFAYRLVHERALRAIRLGRRGAIRIPRSELDRFFREHSIGRESQR